MTKHVEIDKDVLGGRPVFPGTRVPIAALLDYLLDGDSIDEFLVDFPSVRREQAIGLLGEMGREMLNLAKDAA